jgi:hypothetical protein
LTNTEGVDWNALEYSGACHTETIRAGMQQLLDIGFDPSWPLSPFVLVMRSGEAVDAVRNFVASGGSATGMEAAGMLLCGVSQLGGILYLAMFLPFVSLVLICATPITAVIMACARVSLAACSSLATSNDEKGVERAVNARRTASIGVGASPNRVHLWRRENDHHDNQYHERLTNTPRGTSSIVRHRDHEKQPLLASC